MSTAAMETVDRTNGAGRSASLHKWWRPALVACVLLGLLLGGGWAVAQCRAHITPAHAQLLDVIIAAAFIAYVLAMALPFVPGIEIGLALMLVLGVEGILAVYAATQLALLLSYLVGRWVPAYRVGAAFRWLGMERAAGLVESIDATPPGQRLARLAQRAPARWLAALGSHHGLLLAAALNVPGNTLIGGAGGIGMMAGMSRAYSLPGYALLVAAATTPVPLFLLLRAAG